MKPWKKPNWIRPLLDMPRHTDAFERSPPGHAYGFRVDPATSAQDQRRWEAWQHEPHDPNTGQGIPMRNEAEVDAISDDILQADWSDGGNQRFHPRAP